MNYGRNIVTNLKLMDYKPFENNGKPLFDVDERFDCRAAYNDTPAVNYSSLKRLAEHPSTLREERELFDGLRKGGALDTYLFDGKHAFQSMYHVLSIERPTTKLADVADDLMGLHGFSWPFNSAEEARKALSSDKPPDEITQIWNLMKQALDNIQYNARQKDHTRIEALCNMHDYIVDKIAAEGKTLLGSSEWDMIQTAVMSLKRNEWTKKYFQQKGDWELYFQVPVFFNARTNSDLVVPAKGLLDILLVNHKKKAVIPADLKSIGYATDRFPGEYIRLMYYIQSSMYYDGLLCATRGDGCVIDEMGDIIDLTNYKIAPFRFVIVSTVQPQTPIVRVCTAHDLYVGKYGGTLQWSNRPIKGFLDLMDEFMWHMKEDKWLYRKEEYDLKGHVPLDVFSPPVETDPINILTT